VIGEVNVVGGVLTSLEEELAKVDGMEFLLSIATCLFALIALNIFGISKKFGKKCLFFYFLA
jgi:hypothetical protein